MVENHNMPTVSTDETEFGGIPIAGTKTAIFKL